MRYQTTNSARAELAAQRASLTKAIGEAAFTVKQAANKKERLQTQLKKTDQQWKTICQEELQGMKLELSAIEVSPWENFCELNPTFKESGAVGHLVHHTGHLYTGSSTMLLATKTRDQNQMGMAMIMMIIALRAISHQHPQRSNTANMAYSIHMGQSKKLSKLQIQVTASI